MVEAAEEAEMNTVEVKEESLSDPGPSTAKTRFSFYDADEVNEALSPSSSDDGPNKRFHFYNAAEVNEKSKDIVAQRNKTLDTLKTRQESPPRNCPGKAGVKSNNATGKKGIPQSKNSFNTTVSMSNSEPTPSSTAPIASSAKQPQSTMPDSNEILRSLQETERERNQRRGHRAADATPRHANTNGVGHNNAQQQQQSSQGGYPHRDDKSSRREEDIAEASLRKRVESFESLKTATASTRDGQKKNPYEDAIREAILLLRQQYRRPPTQVKTVVEPVPTSTISTPADDPVVNSRTPDPIMQSRLEESDNENESSADDDDSTEPSAVVDDTSTFESLRDEEDPSISGLKEGASPPTDAKELEKLAREERIANYASKLAGLETPGPLMATATAEDSDLLSPPADYEARKAQSETLFRESAGAENMPVITRGEPVGSPLAHERPRMDSGADLSVASREDEVQRGVERVLLAILERAGSSDAGDRRGHVGVDRLLQTRSSFDSEDEVRDSLTQALDALVNPQHSHERSSRPSRRVSDNEPSEQSSLDATESAMRTLSVVDELLAEEEALRELRAGKGRNKKKNQKPATAAEPSSPNRDYITPSSTLVEQALSPQSTLSKSDMGTTVSASDTDGDGEGDTSELDHGDSDFEEDTVEESVDGGNDSLSRVLGPLSKKAGGTTGVVLEPSNTPPIQRKRREAEVDDGEGTPDSNPVSPTILQSLSVNAESFMSFMSNALTTESPKDKYSQDKYSAADDQESIDEEARELMRTLCAHLLPYGVDTSSKIQALEKIPVWDDSNPNEAGYRIIRLSKSQLRRVEREFQKMVNTVMEKSEQSLSGAQTKRSNERKDADKGFERDLEEAEELLDREEKRYNAVKKGEMMEKRSQEEEDESSTSESSSSSEDDTYSGSETASSRNVSPSSSEGEPAVISHPDFPGVRPPGKGEMGDLEYFHLPIIYKSNVTGFEPTKDLFLEPGNVVAGQYLVENELGSAAFSTAYRCIDLNSETTGESGITHEEVCLKVIKNTKDFFDQSLDEIKILELLRKTGQCHENHIVEMKTFFYHREHLIIVTELLRQNLFEFGKFIVDNDEEQYFTLPRLCYITRQVLIALRFVHKLRLVHSDVKPENILLGSYSRAKVKLIDFGSSCYLTDRQSSYIQSRSYRAPEVVLGLPYDGKIDVWSLGCVVAEMYTGEVTFQNDSIVSMLSRIEAICGAFPRHMIAQGRQSGRFFTSSGLLYEQVDSSNDDEKKEPSGLLNFDHEDDEDLEDSGRRRLQQQQPRESQPLFDVFQPKSTTLAARLGFDANLMERPKGTAEEQEQAMFVDFVRSLLTIDPDGRPSADEALQHPWIVMGESLTEEDIKYPSS